MTNRHRMPAANSSRHGVQSVFKTQTARGRSADTLRLGENEGSAEYGRLPIWMAALVTSGCRATSADSGPGRARQPNQRARRLAPKSRFSATSSGDGGRNVPVGLGPDRKSTSTRPTRPSPSST